MIRNILTAAGLALLAGCATGSLDDPPAPELAAFKLGHNVVVAPNIQKGPVSRDATAEEWIAVLKSAVDDRFGRYDGDQFYHFGISVEGFMLAPPGVPLVLTPKSALIVSVTVWDDAAGKKLNERVHQITALETTTGESAILGSGLQRTKEQQMAGLAFNAVRQIEQWMLKQNAEKGWFRPRGETADATAAAPRPVPVPAD